jgi:DNA-binding CsgD family transcriptional regulator
MRLDDMLPQIVDQVAWSVVTTWTPWVWIGTGEYERAIAYADRLLLDARARGLDRGVGLWCLAPRALAEFWLGRWDDATATIGRQGDYTWGIDAAVYLRSVAACIAAAREDPERGRSLANEAIEIARSGFPEQTMIARCAGAWVELLDSHPDVALDHVTAGLAASPRWEGLVNRSLLLWLGSWAAADLAAWMRSRDDRAGLRHALKSGTELSAAVDAAIAQSAAPAVSAAGGPRLTLELARAEAARLERRDQAGTWESLGERFERSGDRPRAAIARLREAEAMLRDRADRSSAAGALHTALGHAETMGALRLRDRVVAIARAGRLDVASEVHPEPAAVRHVGEPWGLSGRELEVLALLAEGRTNRQIGDALFISDKTASVHVTHILDKLGVSRRTEAALLAIRAGIGGTSSG